MASWLGFDVSKIAEYYGIFQLFDREFLRDLVLEEPVLVKEITALLGRVMHAVTSQLRKRRKEAYLSSLTKLKTTIDEELARAIVG
jgi:hypothetical protein